MPLLAPGRGRGASRPAALDVLLVTEGTYPHVLGGVSAWCDLLLRNLPEVRWRVLPIVAGGLERSRLFQAPANVTVLEAVDLWSEDLPAWRWRDAVLGRGRPSLPAELVRGLLGWSAEPASVVDALVWCRRNPAAVRQLFRSVGGWASFLDGLREVLDERPAEAARAPELDLGQAANLYQTLYWLARTAAVATPPADVVHLTAAGWSAIPGVVHQALHGTPLLLTEHGVYVREAYLAAVRGTDGPQGRFVATRLARGLARLAYARADCVAPVTEANAGWERSFGVDPERIRVVPNGVAVPARPTPLPGTSTVVAVGRIDPLKDLHTLLLVAAEVVKRLPDARFRHYGPADRAGYARSCYALHERLGLGDRFRFMGPTSDPHGAVRDADVAVMTSISEGLPLSVLEAMGQGRPVVSTGVGGVSEVVRGCGLTAPPGDVHELAMAVCTLLEDPALAACLGARGHARVARRFTIEGCVGGYRDLLWELAAARRAG